MSYSPEPGHAHHWQGLAHVSDHDSHDWYFTCGCCAVMHVYEYMPADERARVRHENLHAPMSWGAANAHGLANGLRWAVAMAMVAWAYAIREYVQHVGACPECGHPNSEHEFYPCDVACFHAWAFAPCSCGQRAGR